MRSVSDIMGVNAGESNIVEAVDGLIAAVENLGLIDAVRLLKIARLEIVAQLNGITADELKAFACALAKRAASHP